jgi:hypothetical protein
MKRELPARFVVLSNTSTSAHSLHFKGLRHLIDFVCTLWQLRIKASGRSLDRARNMSSFLTLQYRIFLPAVLTRIICIFSRFTASRDEWCTVLQNPHRMSSNTLQHLPNCHRDIHPITGHYTTFLCHVQSSVLTTRNTLNDLQTIHNTSLSTSHRCLHRKFLLSYCLESNKQ